MRKPTEKEVLKLAADLGISFGANESEKYAELVAKGITALENVESMPKPELGSCKQNQRSQSYEPGPEEDPFNAWITKCEIEGNQDGPLAGTTIGLKDNISLGGVPLTNGSEVMQGYIPATDATVVKRLLQAGATIIGKTNMWSFSLGPSDYGQVENPAAPEYSIGGSSSGSAAAVANNEIDIGMGGDQAGSVRIPASFAGLVGMKPTHGLIPYTGIFGADPTQDHTGPITRTVEEAARTTEVLAGRDGYDPRQPPDLCVSSYTEALDEDISDMTVGVLSEGFEHEAGDSEVNEKVRDAIRKLEQIGAETREISVPRHLDTEALSAAITMYGTGQVLQQSGIGFGFRGLYDTHAMDFVGRALDSQASDLPAYVIEMLIISEYIQRNYQGTVYGKAQNIINKTREEYNNALTDVDALVLPTIPIKPPEFGDRRTLDTLLEPNNRNAVIGNTGIFNLTHHPALTVPCGTVDGAPVGLMFVGERFDESTLFHLGYAYEQAT